MLNKIRKLKSNTEFMKYFHNTSWLFFDKIFKMGVGFFLIVYLTRYLGPERFGQISYAQSFVSIFMAFASLGISQVLIRDLVNFPNQKNKLLGTAFSLTFLASLVSIFLIYLIESLFLEDNKTIILVYTIAITIIFQNFNIIIDSYFQHKVLSKKIVQSGNIGFVISTIIKFYLIYIKADLVYFAYGLVFDAALLSLLFYYVYLRENESILLWKFDKEIAINFIKVSLPLVMVAVSAFVYTRIDQIMLQHMMGSEAVGNYAAAIKVSELFYFIPGIIVTSLFPKLVEFKKEDEKKYLQLLEKMYRLVIWIAIPIAIGIFIFSDKIVGILYGYKYMQAGEILAILAWGIIFASISAVFVKMLYVEHWEKKYLYKNLFGVFVNLTLNYFLIKLIGVKGAAIATIITLFLINFVFDILDKDLRKYFYLKIRAFLLIRGVKD